MNKSVKTKLQNKYNIEIHNDFKYSGTYKLGFLMYYFNKKGLWTFNTVMVKSKETICQRIEEVLNWN